MQAIIRGFFKITLLPLAKVMYRHRVLHADRVPETGGVLLISNHTTYIDALLIYHACPRPVRFVIVSRFMNVKAIGWYLRLFGAIPIRLDRPRDAIRKSVEALAAGDVVCIFPEGQLTRTGTLQELQKGYQLIAKKSGAQVVPMFLDGLWDSIYSFEGGHHFWKWPRRMPCPVRTAFGEPMPAEDADLEWARSTLLALSAETFAARKEIDWSLGEAAVRGLKQRPGAACFIEHGKRHRLLKRGQVLAMAAVLADRWRQSLPEEEDRIGVLLPPGWTPGLINLAVVFSGRVPINLPFDVESLDPETLSENLDRLGIRSVVTSKAFASQLAGFPWKGPGGQFIDIGGELSSANLVRVLFERLLARLEPKAIAVGRLGLRETGSGHACGYLPKGASEPVMVSSRALIANALQLTNGEFVHRHERIFCEAPLDSAAGLAFSLWLPVLRGITCSGRSFAMRESRSMIETAIDADEVSLIVGREPLIDQLEGLKEPWHPEVSEAVRAIYFFPAKPLESTAAVRPFEGIESQTGAPVCVGWAPDPLGIVLSVSFPDLEKRPGSAQATQLGRRDGAVGRLLPGFSPKSEENGPLLLEGTPFSSSEPVSTGHEVRISEDGFAFPGSKTLP